MPHFSIIIPTYNDSKRLPRAIKSVINQTVSSWELIVVDDGSNDGTENVVKEFLTDERICFISKDNEGVAAARNAGFDKRTGDYIVFLDSDDEMGENLLGDYLDIISKNPKTGYISCGLLMNGEKRLPKIQKGISEYKYSVIPGSFCIDSEIFKSIGKYDVKLKQGENWEMVARALAFCKENNRSVNHINTCNLLYHHFKTAEKVKQRDLQRAQAHEYMANKYAKSGVLNFKKCDFLLTAAVNYTRAEEFNNARRLFLQNFKCNPGISNLIRILLFEVPFLRKRKWIRN